MAYLRLSPKGNPNTEVKNPLKSLIRRKLLPNIIENRSSRLMISIRKVDPALQGNSHLKHHEHVLNVVRKVISRENVKLRPKPLSIPSSVTKPARMKSLNF